MQNTVAEVVLRASRDHDEPFASVELDCLFTDPSGRELRVPAFWSGAGVWRVRYASGLSGEHRFVTRASVDDPGLHDRAGVVHVVEYEGVNPLYRHGPVHVAADGRHLEHLDRTPFFWLADTWWLAFVERFSWPADVYRLVADRARKGFSVVQLVAGLYPEMHPFDPHGASESGWPWTEGFGSINPAWWNEADLRISCLVEAGIVPCVFGSWGSYVHWMGTEPMKRHWRYLVARWGAYPVVWCLAGEATQALEGDGPDRPALLREAWLEVARFVRRTDPYGRVTTVHPGPGDGSFSSHDIFPSDPSVFDLTMLQTGHSDRQSLEPSLRVLEAELRRRPRKPVINGEVCYEGNLGSNWQDTQRVLFWTHVLSGAAGHTYGAAGLWGFNTGDFVGLAGSWSGATWEEACELPGAAQLGIARRLLEQYEWWRFEPHPEWVEPHWTPEDRLAPYAAGIPGEVRLVYFPGAALLSDFAGLREIRICGLELDRRHRAYHVDPRTGRRLPERRPEPDSQGVWSIRGTLNANPSMEDWLLVVEST